MSVESDSFAVMPGGQPQASGSSDEDCRENSSGVSKSDTSEVNSHDQVNVDDNEQENENGASSVDGGQEKDVATTHRSDSQSLVTDHVTSADVNNIHVLD